MNLYVNDFDRISNFKQFPELKWLFTYPHARWICANKSNLSSSVRRFCNRAKSSIPVFVLYNIPNRDLNHYSRGGSKNESEYLEFIKAFSDGLSDTQSIIVIEPDAIPHAMHDNKLLDFRIHLMNSALSILSSRNVHAKTYIDIGHPNWIHYSQIIDALSKVVNPFTGFSVNVSNFVPLNQCLIYSQMIAQKSKKTFIVDTSRNGALPVDHEWCNPSWARIGHVPTLNTGIRNCDGYLWIKIPGESDGYANNGIKAGRFSPSLASNLMLDINR